MKILFYGTASYDKDSFTKELKDYPEIKIDFIETNLTPMTAALARGYDAVCAFVNADAGAMTLEILAGFGVKLVLMRCAGFDAVNVPVAEDLGLKVTRVPAYSPEAIAEPFAPTAASTRVTSASVRMTSTSRASSARPCTARPPALSAPVASVLRSAASARASA